jgi:hypothetical protein
MRLLLWDELFSWGARRPRAPTFDEHVGGW